MARLLRLAATAVMAAAVGLGLLPYLWFVTIGPERNGLPDTYFVFEFSSVVGLHIIAGIAALMLVALARILDRLDRIQGRSDVHGQPTK